MTAYVMATEKRALILRCFTEGLSVNATARTADCSKNTVLKFLADLGPVCRDFQVAALTNLLTRSPQHSPGLYFRSGNVSPWGRSKILFNCS